VSARRRAVFDAADTLASGRRLHRIGYSRTCRSYAVPTASMQSMTFCALVMSDGRSLDRPSASERSPASSKQSEVNQLFAIIPAWIIDAPIRDCAIRLYDERPSAPKSAPPTLTGRTPAANATANEPFATSRHKPGRPGTARAAGERESARIGTC